jgi:hypothetical protein
MDMEYQPGVCNIGKDEINKRYAFAAAGFVIAAILLYAIFSFAITRWALVFPFIALVMGFEGFYQGYLGFCAGFAARGVYDLSGSGGSKGKVKDAKSHRIDLDKATQIHVYSVVSGVIVIAIIYLAIR